MSSYNESRLVDIEDEQDAAAAYEAELEAATERAFQELNASFLLAIDSGDSAATVPCSIGGSLFGTSRRVLKQQKLADALWDSMANSNYCEGTDYLLLLVLRISRCPHVAALKAVLAKNYADMHAEGMAQLDLQNKSLRKGYLL